MEDSFNYYAFEINTRYGFKRILKVNNGFYQVLIEKRDGGLSLNEWHKVQITARKSKFLIRIGRSNKFRSYDAAPLIFRFHNETFTKGR